MSISDRSRKILWGRSGNKCALCKHDLVMNATDTDDESVVGDECHIVSGRPDGPRGRLRNVSDDLDACGNLILLCKVCHKLVDDQANGYTPDQLRQAKKAHEQWVTSTLRAEVESEGASGDLPAEARDRPLTVLPRLASGQELFDVLSGSDGFNMHHDGLRSEEEVDLVGGFLQEARDWGEIQDDLEPMTAVQTQYHLTESIKELESKGFMVFGAKRRSKVKSGGTTIYPFIIASVAVARKDSPHVIHQDTHLAARMEPKESTP